MPVYHFGAVVGTRRVHNDRLLMFILRNRASTRFAADSRITANAATLSRLKREWRAEWEAEAAARAEEDSERIIQSINAKLDLMRQRQLEWDGDEAEDEGDEPGPTQPNPSC